MDTPEKRTFSEVEPDSSPEVTQPKRCNMSDMEAIKLAIQSIQSQVGEISSLKALVTETNGSMESTHGTLIEIKESLSGLVSRVSDTEEKVKDLTAAVNVYKQENTYLKRRVSQLEEKAIRQEAYDRRDNLILDGIPFRPREDIIAKVREVFRVNLKCADADNFKITRAHRLANKRKIIVRFHFFGDRETVWGLRRNLQGSNIWLEEDFPTEWRNRRQVLLPIYRAALKGTNTKASMVQDRLIINSQTFTVNNLATLPSSLLQYNTSLHSTDEDVYFFSKSSPLSNFFPSRILDSAAVFNCAEQAYTVEKASVNGDHEAADDIRMMTDPADMFRRAKLIKEEPSKWTEGRRLKTMENVLRLKYTQNPHLRDVLLSTGTRRIWEASASDAFFGAGLNISKIKKTLVSEIPGKNHLGQILVRIRAGLE